MLISYSFFVQIVFKKNMPNKKLTKFKTKRKKVKDKSSGLAKLASITTKSLSSAITNYKKNQEICSSNENFHYIPLLSVALWAHSEPVVRTAISLVEKKRQRAVVKTID